jgi:hypothetical protein
MAIDEHCRLLLIAGGLGMNIGSRKYGAAIVQLGGQCWNGGGKQWTGPSEGPVQSAVAQSRR